MLRTVHRVHDVGQELSNGSIAAEEEIERVWAGRVATQAMKK